MRTRIVLAVVTAGVLAALAWAIRDARPPAEPPGVPVAEALGGAPVEGFARALGPRPFVFPRDHGPHPEFRTEWWYWTGNLAATDGRRFGMQLTFFRIALAPDVVSRASAWAARDVWMAHFAVTDVAGGRFTARSRLSRGALGLAGAVASPFRVWLTDWSVTGADARAAMPVVRLVAADGDVAVDIALESAKPVVLQGDRGFSRKSAEPGNASYYYSLTRLRAAGEVRVGADRFRVRGLAWMDREWSTSALGRDQVGWDWFALQLDDGRDVMVYRIRRADGSVDPASAGTVVAPDGTARPLGATDVSVETLAWWSSPRDGTRYPARWRVAIARERLVLEVAPRLADQELTDPVRYWEGAVAVTGQDAGRELRGDGYVELVGYARGAAARDTATMGR